MICRKGLEDCEGETCEHWDELDPDHKNCFDEDDSIDDEVEEEMIKEDPTDIEKRYLDMIDEDDYDDEAGTPIPQRKKPGDDDEDDLYGPPIITPPVL